MRKIVLLTSAAALLASLALAQAYGPPAERGPAARQAIVGERAPAAVQTLRETRREEAVATRAAHQQASMAQTARMQGSAGLGGQLQGVVASVIGLPEDEVHALKQEGASFASIAAEQGVDAATVEAAYLAAREGVIANLLETGAITELQAEQMTARGAAAFAALFEREGCDEGQNVTGERLFANRAEMARGPQAGEPIATGQPQGRGPRARW
ncbi:MAG: hypothetical protein K0A98_13580 [Trueperaceae bacterium]|nr:hypothetical protein [Trueperaceae bacterium]